MTQTIPMPLKFTLKAIDKASELRSRESDGNLSLRVSVSAGGCSGLRYALYFDDKEMDGDIKETFEGDGTSQLSVIVDKLSAPYLEGAQVDFVDTIEKQGFIIDNPNAQNSCACGDSFS